MRSATGLTYLRFGRTKTPNVQQSLAAECGLACVAMISAFHGHCLDMPSLRRSFRVSWHGTTLKSLLQIAGAIGLSGRGLRCEPEHLRDLALPAILHWNLNHFVVLERVRGNARAFVIHDPATGRHILSPKEFSERFTGIALELTPTPSFQTRNLRPGLRIWQLWTSVQRAWGALGQILALSILLQLMGLVAPLFFQVAIDGVLPAQDYRLLIMLALGFVMLALIQSCTSWLRGRLLVNISQSLSYQLVSNLAQHMFRLPLSWFEMRHAGDVISRFGSTKPVSDLLAKGLIAGIVDGALAFITFGFMLLYSVPLALLAIVVLGVYGAINIALLPAQNRLSAEALSAEAKETSIIVESLRGISSIKAFNQEKNRLGYWRSHRVSAVNAHIRLGGLTNVIEVWSQAVLFLENVLFILIAVVGVMESRLTLGMIFALVAYKTQFFLAGTRFFNSLTQYRALDVHLNRIAEIIETDPEEEDSPSTNWVSRGALEVRGVSFSYGFSDAAILDEVHLTVQPGETIAITGASGAGKTTLVKVLMGLLEPTQGQVFVDGIPLGPANRRAWRSELGYVAQEDILYAGSVAENIAFFDEEMDRERVTEAAKLAIIHEDICRMPMGYDSVVGDLGSSLSGGQKARVMLARALYRRPRLLMIDEGTAHLDVDTEREVNRSLGRLHLTRVIVAHRPETIRAADRIFSLRAGRLEEIDKARLLVTT